MKAERFYCDHKYDSKSRTVVHRTYEFQNKAVRPIASKVSPRSSNSRLPRIVDFGRQTIDLKEQAGIRISS